MKEHFVVSTAERVSRMVNGLVSINHVYSGPLTQVTVCARCVNVRVFLFVSASFSLSLSLSLFISLSRLFCSFSRGSALSTLEHQGFNRPLMRVLVLRSHSEESANGCSMTWQVIVSDYPEFFGVPRSLCMVVDSFLKVAFLCCENTMVKCH